MAILRRLLRGQLCFNDKKGDSDSKEEEEEQEAIEEVDPVWKMAAQMAEMMKQIAEMK